MFVPLALIGVHLLTGRPWAQSQNAPQAQAPTQLQTSLPADHVFRTNTKLAGGYATVAGKDGAAAWTVSGDNLTLDFGGAVFRSSKTPDQNLNEDQGIGVLIDGAHNVTIKNLNVHGYQWNIVLRNCTNVVIDGGDASYSKAIVIADDGTPLNSFLNLRSLDAWRTYGAGVWIEDSKDCTVQNVKACESQNGFLVVNSSRVTLLSDDGSFNSGWGIGLWASDHSRILWCLADFCSRPWAGGWGGDAAGIVAANRCHENVFFGDSMTHGGDGFFLSDRVVGGYSDADKTYHWDGASNDNLIAFCDGSWSSHNAFEGTFSERNVYLDNKANDSQYGFWIGFSNDSVIAGNEITGNVQQGVAGTQASRTRVEKNTFSGNTEDVAFWSDAGPVAVQSPANDEELFENKSDAPLKVFMRNASGVIYGADGKITQTFGTPSAALPPANDAARVRKDLKVQMDDGLASRPGDFQFYRETNGPKGEMWIQPGQFAPIDFRNHLFAASKQGQQSLVLYPLQPAQTVKVTPGIHFVPRKDVNEVELVPDSPKDGVGSVVPYTVTVVGSKGTRKESLSGTFTSEVWSCAWFSWGKPLLTYGDTAGWDALYASTPLVRTTQTSLNGDFSERSPIPGKVPADHFALAAYTKIRLGVGTLKINTLSDDGIRVYVDGERVIDNWDQHASEPNAHSITFVKPGIHSIRVEYCQETGSAGLTFAWKFIPMPASNPAGPAGK